MRAILTGSGQQQRRGLKSTAASNENRLKPVVLRTRFSGPSPGVALDLRPGRWFSNFSGFCGHGRWSWAKFRRETQSRGAVHTRREERRRVCRGQEVLQGGFPVFCTRFAVVPLTSGGVSSSREDESPSLRTIRPLKRAGHRKHSASFNSVTRAR